MPRRLLGFCAATLVLACVFSMRCSAIEIEYGDFTGTNYMFLDVTEDTRDEPSALFGAPSVTPTGEMMDFDPPNFSASANNSNPSKVTDGQLNFVVMSASGSFPIDEVVIDEAGDYTLTGLGNANAVTTVGSAVIFEITHVDGTALSLPIQSSGNMVFQPIGNSNSLGQCSVAGDVITGEYGLQCGDAGTAVIWSGSFTADIAGTLAASGISGAATKVSFAIDNTLTAAAADGGSAFIAKKDSGVTVTVPEPASFFLAALSLLPLTWIRRR